MAVLSSANVVMLERQAYERRRRTPPGPPSPYLEDLTKSLIISGPDEAFARIEALIENLDVAPPRAETELRFFQLEHAQAERMAQMFRPILLGRMQELMPDLQDQPSAVEVTAEPETNTLIVTAPVALQDVAQELVDRLDRSSYAGRRTFRTQRLDPSVADAEEIARNLRRLLEREGGPRVRVMTLEELLSEQSASEQKSEPKIPGQDGISAHSISGLVAAAALGALPESDAADVDNEEADLIVAVVMACLFLWSASQIVRQARTELIEARDGSEDGTCADASHARDTT